MILNWVNIDLLEYIKITYLTSDGKSFETCLKKKKAYLGLSVKSRVIDNFVHLRKKGIYLNLRMPYLRMRLLVVGKDKLELEQRC